MLTHVLIVTTSVSILASGAMATDTQADCAQAHALRIPSVRQYSGAPLPPASSGGPIFTIRPSLGPAPVPQPSTGGAPIPGPSSGGDLTPTLQPRSGQDCIS